MNSDTSVANIILEIMLKHFLVVLAMSTSSALGTMANTFSRTIAEGSALKKNQFVSGELIFEDTFERLDSTKWLHEPTNAAVSAQTHQTSCNVNISYCSTCRNFNCSLTATTMLM